MWVVQKNSYSDSYSDQDKEEDGGEEDVSLDSGVTKMH